MINIFGTRTLRMQDDGNDPGSRRSCAAVVATTRAKESLTDLESSVSMNDHVIPGPNDVLLGRGKGNEKHPGNILLKEHIVHTLPRFTVQPRGFKKHIINETVQWVKSRGRFLSQKRKGNDMFWFEAGPDETFQRIAQSYRYQQRGISPLPMANSRELPVKETWPSRRSSDPASSLLFEAMKGAASLPHVHSSAVAIRSVPTAQHLHSVMAAPLPIEHNPTHHPKLSMDEESSLGDMSPLAGDELVSDWEILSAVGELRSALGTDPNTVDVNDHAYHRPRLRLSF